MISPTEIEVVAFQIRVKHALAVQTAHTFARKLKQRQHLK